MKYKYLTIDYSDFREKKPCLQYIVWKLPSTLVFYNINARGRHHDNDFFTLSRKIKNV